MSADIPETKIAKFTLYPFYYKRRLNKRDIRAYLSCRFEDREYSHLNHWVLCSRNGNPLVLRSQSRSVRLPLGSRGSWSLLLPMMSPVWRAPLVTNNSLAPIADTCSGDTKTRYTLSIRDSAARSAIIKRIEKTTSPDMLGLCIWARF